MCANELAEVRKLVKILTQTQIAIERIVLRLETIKELSTLMIDLKPALTALKSVTANLVETMPDIAIELDKVNDSIQDTLTVTKLSSEQPITYTNLKTPAGEEILKEVNNAIEQRLTEQLPEPPASEAFTEAPSTEEKIREMVALAIGHPESSQTKNETSEAVLSIKDVKMQSISLTIKQGESVEEKLLEHIKQCKGKLDLTECAISLKIPPKEVEKTLKKLGEEGKIIIGT